MIDPANFFFAAIVLAIIKDTTLTAWTWYIRSNAKYKREMEIPPYQFTSWTIKAILALISFIECCLGVTVLQVPKQYVRHTSFAYLIYMKANPCFSTLKQLLYAAPQSQLFGDQSKTIALYDKFLTDIQ